MMMVMVMVVTYQWVVKLCSPSLRLPYDCAQKFNSCFWLN